MPITSRSPERTEKPRVPSGETWQSAVERRRIQRAQRIAREDAAFKRIDAYFEQQAKLMQRDESGMHPRCALGTPVRENTPRAEGAK